MKKLYPFLLFVLIANVIFAAQVNENDAKTVASNFLKNIDNTTFSENLDKLQLVYTAQGKNLQLNTNNNYYYVFNIADKGFIMLAADDVVYPVLAYSYEGAYNPETVPSSVEKWVEGYKNQIRYAIETNMEATDDIANKWQALRSATVPNYRGETAVAPLLSTKWDQSPYYNANCPYDSYYGERSVTGCVATAMAQIMKFWNFPATGSGFHSYNHPRYGTLSSNFASSTYNWASMPNMVSSTNSAVAQLMYDCGVSVDMNYGVASAGGSGAYIVSSGSPTVNCSEYAFKTYFSYKSTLSGRERDSYSESNWINLMKAELDAGRPILYGGVGSGGGHCFVNDGYDNSNYFHMNWGWSGSYDGYFAIGALNPGGVGTGGGTGGFNSGQVAVIGIEPSTGGGGGSTTTGIVLSTYVTLSASTIYYGDAFSVQTNIGNSSTSTFNGDLCAALFDSDGDFVDFVQIGTGFTLNSGSTFSSNITFSNAGSFSFLPGAYTVGVFYRPTGGNWIAVGNNSSYTNFVALNIINPSNIETYSTITPTPTTFTQGQAASVNFNVANATSSIFYGAYAVNLYDLEGNYVETIGSYSETGGLPGGYTYNPPYLTVTTSSISAEPGTYLLAVIYQASGTSSWYLTGSSSFQNPVKVNVQAAPLSPDVYEVNNTVAQAYKFSPYFASTTSNANTNGSNCHIGSDYDFYEIYLEPNYHFTITPRLHDSYNSGNGNTYSLDALFSYSFDGVNWSESYDDVMPSPIDIGGNTTIYFAVAPYYTGEVGTYLLDINMSRFATTGLSDLGENRVRVYPNPAISEFTIDLSAIENTNITQCSLFDMMGKKVLERKMNDLNGQKTTLKVTDLARGTYLLKLTDDKGQEIHIQKMNINK